jgi:hypothetical protein
MEEKQMLTEGFTLEVEKLVRTPETVSPEMWQLAIERGELSAQGEVVSPTRVIVIFRPTDAEGRYREDVEPVRREMSDLPGAANPRLHNFVTLMRQCLIKAVIPHEEPFLTLGVEGLSIEQAGPLLMDEYFALVTQESAPEE